MLEYKYIKDNKNNFFGRSLYINLGYENVYQQTLNSYNKVDILPQYKLVKGLIKTILFYFKHHGSPYMHVICYSLHIGNNA